MLEKIQAMLAEALNLPLEKVTTDAKIVDDLGADSLDTVELIMALEEAFDIEIPDDKAENIKTVGEAISYIEAAAKK